ncbi:hypothetical protein ACJEBK_19795 [Peribacillus frigoritolerans]
MMSAEKLKKMSEEEIRNMFLINLGVIPDNNEKKEEELNDK